MKRFNQKPVLLTAALVLFLGPILCCCLANDVAAANTVVTESSSASAHCHKEEATAVPESASGQDAGCECHQISAALSPESFRFTPAVFSLSDFVSVLDETTLSEVNAYKEPLNLSFLSPPAVENDPPLYLTLANFRL